MIELALFTVTVLAIIAFVVWSVRQAKIDAYKHVTADEQAEILGRVGAQKEIEDELDQELRSDRRRSAADRLRDEWSDK